MKRCQIYRTDRKSKVNFLAENHRMRKYTLTLHWIEQKRGRCNLYFVLVFSLVKVEGDLTTAIPGARWTFDLDNIFSCLHRSLGGVYEICCIPRSQKAHNSLQYHLRRGLNSPHLAPWTQVLLGATAVPPSQKALFKHASQRGLQSYLF